MSLYVFLVPGVVDANVLEYVALRFLYTSFLPTELDTSPKAGRCSVRSSFFRLQRLPWLPFRRSDLNWPQMSFFG